MKGELYSLLLMILVFLLATSAMACASTVTVTKTVTAQPQSKYQPTTENSNRESYLKKAGICQAAAKSAMDRANNAMSLANACLNRGDMSGYQIEMDDQQRYIKQSIYYQNLANEYLKMAQNEP